ncbi:hypothetical protein C7M61_004001 [Candidozyma pseudohaemuli]|uniref:Uncharacterized protein n=1 Tax=Candidozyma pseudohaemuli TaxID=418784 RepID=A0A2P7YKM6_9ASCO|nr:hypothetical protein C7M61_004001 [[Candida] pseudohaemulonii]PSK36528.1 hypothetical protein C7M61_004001 [[Candida] pseudohaemulonii]
MNSTSLHIIERERIFNGINLAILSEVDDRPSNYVSHETFTCKIDGEGWSVSTLNLREISAVPQDALEEMKKSEGILKFGKWPDWTDGRGRIVYCFTRMNQLLIDHHPPTKDLKKNSLVGIRCLQIRDDLVPLDVGVTPIRTRSSLNTLDTLYAPEAFVDVTVEKSIEVDLLATYKPPEQYELILPGNMVKSGSCLKHFVQLELKLTNTFFCSCKGDVFIKQITIILEEHLRYQHLELKGCRVSEEVRTVVLKDSSINYSISHTDFKNIGTGFFYFPEVSMYNCNLPNIGPTYSSNKCTRSYSIRFNIDLECASKKCTQRIFTVMEIAVATEVGLSEPILQVHKKQDVVLVKNFPLNSNLGENAIRYCFKTRDEMSLDMISFHLSSVVEGDKALVIATLHTTDCYDMQSERKVKEIESSEVLALYPRKGVWTVNAAKLTTSIAGIPGRMFQVSRFVNVFDKFRFSNSYGSRQGRYSFMSDYRGALMAGPGMTLDSTITFKFISSCRSFVSIYFSNLEVILGQQTVKLNKNCREAIHKEYKLHSENGKHVSFREIDENGQKSFLFEGLLEGCKIPNVLPSTFSHYFHKGYKLNVSIEAHGTTVGSDGCMKRIDCNFSESIEVLMGINECYRLVRKEGHEKTYIN